MATAPDAAPSPSTPPPPTPSRWRQGTIATLLMLAAALVLVGLRRTAIVATSDDPSLFLVTAGLIALALPGPLLRVWDVPGQLLLWNATGWCLALLVLGIATIGALTMLPLILLLFALTFWPRAAGVPPLWLPGAIALIGGFLVCVIRWQEIALPF